MEIRVSIVSDFQNLEMPAPLAANVVVVMPNVTVVDRFVILAENDAFFRHRLRQIFDGDFNIVVKLVLVFELFYRCWPIFGFFPGRIVVDGQVQDPAGTHGSL